MLCLLVSAGFVALGVWQLERRAWKLDLIARVEARLAAPPVAAPGVRQWPRLEGRSFEYRRVRVAGIYLQGRETLVKAVTGLGPGFWVMTPLRMPEGIVLVNRGFVPEEQRDAATRQGGVPPGKVVVTGLMRLSEPNGAFLRHNAPAAERWYSRDVATIARARGLGAVAPFFIDADATPNPGGYPVGGLTQVRFSNNHLLYALTWFGLAALSLVGAAVFLAPDVRRG